MLLEALKRLRESTCQGGASSGGKGGCLPLLAGWVAALPRVECRGGVGCHEGHGDE